MCLFLNSKPNVRWIQRDGVVPCSGQVLWGLDGAGEESPRRGQHHVRSLVIRPERVDRQCPLVSRATLLRNRAMACPGSFCF